MFRNIQQTGRGGFGPIVRYVMFSTCMVALAFVAYSLKGANDQVTLLFVDVRDTKLHTLTLDGLPVQACIVDLNVYTASKQDVFELSSLELHWELMGVDHLAHFGDAVLNDIVKISEEKSDIEVLVAGDCNQYQMSPKYVSLTGRRSGFTLAEQSFTIKIQDKRNG